MMFFSGHCAAMATDTLCGGGVCSGDFLHVLLHGFRGAEGGADDGREGGETGQ